MAKSALEAVNGLNLFGDKGAAWSVVYVDIDAHNRNRAIFETLLPRESSSKVHEDCYLEFWNHVVATFFEN
jgi:phosphorylase kinase alpha/beta subunit